MIVNKIQEVYAACKVFGHDVVRGILSFTGISVFC